MALPARRAAAALSRRSSPCRYAQTSAAMTASPPPVVLTMQVGRHGRCTGEDAVGPHAEKHALHALRQQRRDDALGRGLAREVLPLGEVGLERVQRTERRAHPLRLRDGDGVGKERGAAVRAEPGDGLGRQVAVEHDGGRAVEHIEMALEIRRRDGGGDVRIAQAELHLAALVRDVEIRRRAPAGHVERAAEIHAELHAVVAQELGV